MKLLIVSLAVAGLASAQNATLIPSDISSSCSTFLSTLNTDSTLSTCVQPLINATSSFSPVSGANLTTSDINYTLAGLCKNTASCSDGNVRTWLTNFYSSCSSELTGSGYNVQVRELYDILYVVNPLKAAVCAIDSGNQDYCVNRIRASLTGSANSTSANTTTATTTGTNSTGATNGTFATFATATDLFAPVAYAADHLYIALSSTSSSLAKRLVSLIPRQDAQASFATIITPNSTTYRDTNLPFLFLQPSMTSSQLCTPCTREVLVAYIKWETTVPYALGLAQSPILGGQGALWNAIGSTCGTAYTNAIKSQVGSLALSSNSTSAAAERWQGKSTSVVLLAGAGVAGALALLA